MKPTTKIVPNNLYHQVGAKMSKQEQNLIAGLCPEGHKIREKYMATLDQYLVALMVYQKTRDPKDHAIVRDLLPGERAASHAWSDYLMRTQARRMLRTLIRNLSATLPGSSLAYRAKTNFKIRELQARLERFEKAAMESGATP